MSEAMSKKIAEKANMIVGGYAIIVKKSGYQIVNLYSGNVAMVSKTYKVLSTSMPDIELSIAIDRLKNNLEFLAA